MRLDGFFAIFIFVVCVMVFLKILGKALGVVENSQRNSSLPSGNPLTGLFTGGARNEAWMEAAYAQELEYVRPGGLGGRPSLRGYVDEQFTEVHIQDSGSGELQTVVNVMFARPLHQELLILMDDDAVRGERFAGRKTFRVAGLENPRLQCAASDAGELQKLLTPVRLNALKNALAFYHYFEISDRYALVKLKGECRDAEALSALIEFTVSLAALFSSESAAAAVSSVRSAPIPVEVSEPVPELRRPMKRMSPEPPPPVPVPELSVPDEVTPIPEPVAEKTSPEPPPPSAVTESAPAVEPQAPEPPEIAVLDQTAFAASLFAASFPGAKEQAVFAVAKGTRVEWCGILRSAYSFGNDFVLGAGPGVKAGFEIAEVTGAYSMKNKVRAIVRLPEDSLPLLKNHNGESFRFSGVLEKMEPYARELILLDGELK